MAERPGGTVSAVVLRGDAAHLSLPDGSVDLICTSPPYFGLRAYSDGGEVYPGQIGAEDTPAEYIAALLACTREWMRVLKPSGSMFVNLGDRYAARTGAGPNAIAGERNVKPAVKTDVPPKSLYGLPWRYALGCIDQLGLILRAEVIWDKPNGLPESVTDRVRRSHEQVFHFTKQERYFSAVDEIREPCTMKPQRRPAGRPEDRTPRPGQPKQTWPTAQRDEVGVDGHPLGKLPGSVWKIPSAPLIVPAWLGVDHFAAWPPDLCREMILGWSPSGICTCCGEGRFPVADRTPMQWRESPTMIGRRGDRSFKPASGTMLAPSETRITGYACTCTPYTSHPGTAGRERTGQAYARETGRDAHPHGGVGVLPRTGPWREYHLEDWDAPPTRPAVVVDPFGGTGTTALVADVLGRTGYSFDMSADYCRLARWRTRDPGERARALGVPKPPPVPEGQGSLFDDLGEAS